MYIYLFYELDGLYGNSKSGAINKARASFEFFSSFFNFARFFSNAIIRMVCLEFRSRSTLIILSNLRSFNLQSEKFVRLAGL